MNAFSPAYIVLFRGAVKNKLLPVIVVGLMVQASPAHADESLFDSLKGAVKDAASSVNDHLKGWYQDATGDSDDSPTPTAAAPSASDSPIPVSSPIPSPSPTGPSFSQCDRFLGVMYSPSDVTDPQKRATIYLNAVLDFMSVDVEAKPSDEEIAQRNKCVELALDAGADPNGDGIDKDMPVPLARAVRDNDEPAVRALLDHKANPNASDTSLGRQTPLLKSALTAASQDVVIDLIQAGADVTIPDLLWLAAAEGDDKVVDLLIQSKKIPVNQITEFSDLDDDEGQTALDPSERGVHALLGYQKKFPVGSTVSDQEKVLEANGVLYYIYPLKPQLPIPAAGARAVVDPDAFINELLIRQQNVSNLLKAAGWTCKEDHCGIADIDSAGSNDESSAL